jgi:arsenate reductase
MDVVIYHNPACGTSRNALALIRNAGVEPHVIEYLKTPPSRPLLRQLIGRMGGSVRDVVREKGTPFAELGTRRSGAVGRCAARRDRGSSDLLNRPIVVTPLGVRLCRPSEAVLELLPAQQGAFTKEDGEPVLDEHGRRVAVA